MATVVAGAVGVIVSILVVQSPATRDLIGQGMVSDFPPFPVDAAVTGLVAATVVGAIAGLLPALVAVRVKVIDAIRTENAELRSGAGNAPPPADRFEE